MEGFAGQAVDTLDSRHFLQLQEMYVQHGHSRQYCNTLMGYIRAMLKWGALRKLVSAVVLAEARLVTGLKKGKTKAHEKKKRKDVSDEVFNRTLPHLLPTLRIMVQVQRSTGMRPSETFNMKVGEIDTGHVVDGVVIWLYVPGTHKNEWRDDNCTRVIPLGKPEQELIAPRLVGKADDDYIFSPKDTMQERYARDAAKRKSKMQPSQVKRKERSAKKPKRRDRDCYDKNSYNRAINHAITAANKRLPDNEKIPLWTPYQLRHAAITEKKLETGSLDIARAFAGQKSLDSTAIYDHADLKIAIEQAVKRSK